MTPMKVDQLSEAQETLLLPLWARAEEARHPSPILHDPKSVEIVESIDFDFKGVVDAGVSQVNYCSRAVIFDRLVSGFLEQHVSATIVEIGAGLDTRFDRLDNGQVRWFDLDLPEAMEVRRAFFEETERRTFLATSALESDWLGRVKQSNPSDVMFVAEGVFYFFTQEQLIELFRMLAEQFPGARIVFDSQSPLYLRYSQLRHPLQDSKLVWSIGNIRQIESWGAGYCVEESVGFGDSPDYDKHLNRFPRLQRWARLVCPPLRNVFRVNQVRLG